MAINRRKWDEAVPLHLSSASYDVDSFRRGRSTLRSLEVRDVGPVRRRSLLHLQCHFGLDTLSWARLGATVTGVDFSGAAVRAARRLAKETGLTATFVHSNVYDLPDVLDETFDIVYTAKGALCWLPDIAGWARVVAHFLKPGGRLYFLEDHPVAEVYPNESNVTRLELKYPYFDGRPQRDVSDGTYAAVGAKMKYRISYSWVHTVSETLSALIDAGLVIEAVREYPYSYWHKFPFMRRGRDGWYHLLVAEGTLPLMWSVRARRAPGPSIAATKPVAR
jgi:SAM-dependent methyltransferase